MFGCFDLIRNADGTSQILFKGIPVRSSWNELVNVLISYNKADDFLQGLFMVSVESKKFLESGKVLRFYLYNATDKKPKFCIDLIESATDRMLLRIKDAEELEAFRTFYTLSDTEKTRVFDQVKMRWIKDPKYVFDPAEAKKAIKRVLKIDLDLPRSATGLAPDYATLKDTIVKGLPVIYKFRDNPCITEIFYSSTRGVDFQLAFKQMGMTAGEIAEAEKNYVWHHLDDWSPVTGKGTMQLVLRSVHTPSEEGIGTALRGLGEALQHVGGVAQWKWFYNINYR